MVTKKTVSSDADDFEALAQDILASANDGQTTVETQLKTSQRIIARVTDGIYREPWAAFRELIANSYDADASHVVIETDVPNFDQITVRDDGIGMSYRTLAYILHNIGGSSKRTVTGVDLHTVQEQETDRSPGGRLLIGKIGIGLFAVAQLTQHFQIITKARGESIRTSATVRLQTHNDDRFQSSEDEHIAGEVTINAEKVPKNEADAQGTSIVLYSLRPEVRRTLSSVQRWNAVHVEPSDGESVQEPPIYHIGLSHIATESGNISQEPRLPWEPSDTPEDKFKKLFEAASDVSGRGTKSADLEHFDEYLRLIWKLSLSLPMDYIDSHPFDLDGSSDLIFFDIPKESRQANRIKLSKDKPLRNRLKLQTGKNKTHSPFSVTLDGIALRRPVRLPLQLKKSSRIQAPVMMAAKQDNPFKDDDLPRAGGRLSFEGYLYWNNKITPKETTGVLIRIREASGTLFDPTFLNYRVSEQTRLRQITAEIFVYEGLDSAVNIDRESFNYSHPHFLYVQKWLHRALRLLVNRLKALSNKDLEREKAERRHQEQTALQTHAEKVWRRRYGEEADPPLPVHSSEGSVPEDVGGVEIEWHPEDIPTESEKARALSVVLEAYGVLSNLPIRDRFRLIKDILDIFKDST